MFRGRAQLPMILARVLAKPHYSFLFNLIFKLRKIQNFDCFLFVFFSPLKRLFFVFYGVHGGRAELAQWNTGRLHDGPMSIRPAMTSVAVVVFNFTTNDYV